MARASAFGDGRSMYVQKTGPFSPQACTPATDDVCKKNSILAGLFYIGDFEGYTI